MALAQKSAAACSRVAARSMGAARPVLPAVSKPAVRTARKAAPASRAATVTKALPMEVAMVAGEGAFIGGVALTMTAITLVGLAIGFVLLRVESLAEEGK
ncbi:Cytochrome b6-f complex subunit 7, chloroplastic [Monoraphidium neglectum]|uniref:Cytochrome b6-f complex subunit 7, chloroplastic n=1 Tax=Monoraphidium neglectum TaxID=145388 RepID=A0A0D2LEJ0_9CHLO|nr:Cytochrome b6-f complex subunit 7, chloroplastic [Monoraphidium neglectum]KIZ05084.1 Cytochrome b6-f complex subunit 7, chloroplastic [Monoraphidium neglectum]|eukprot:XP_013904103.1 Cytochrome b6-f complex subunit 7, chloroplastic [Monoraphidium neglectum]